MNIVIIGGGAAGMSAASKARRMDKIMEDKLVAKSLNGNPLGDDDEEEDDDDDE